MITFKDYLREEDEDKVHRVVKQAAEDYVKYCKDWQDIEVPLYRLSSPQEGAGSHRMKTRVPRIRQSQSQGGTRDVQEFIFKQPGWEKFPDRLKSIFCSTQKEFAVGDIDDYSENLLMIFPFDGTVMGITSAHDFNYIELLTDSSSIMHFKGWVHGFYNFITGQSAHNLKAEELVDALKKILLTDTGKFDPTCNGNEKYAKKVVQLGTAWRNDVKSIVLKLPKDLTPKKLGVRIVYPNTIDLPGDVREVWFSNKYLSIPAADYKEFVKEVKALQTGVELPPKPTTVKRAPVK